MKRRELELEHRYKNRLVGRHYLTPKHRQILGSSREADIRLLGEKVGPIHAAIYFEKDQWILEDLGSDQGTWVNKNPIVEYSLQGTTDVQIGSHHLRLVPHEMERNLFVQSSSAPSRGDLFHQVVVFKNGYVQETHLLGPQENYELLWKGKRQTFAAPSSEEWIATELENVIVKQRRARAFQIEKGSASRVEKYDPQVKIALGFCIFIALVAIGIIFLAPHRPNDSLHAAQPETNLYTKMIYDAKLMAEKRKEALKQKKHIVGQTRQAPDRPTSGNTDDNKIVQQSRESGAQGAKVVSQIKAKQLDQLIGKISKRASLNTLLIGAKGKAPEEAQGRAGADSLAHGTLIDNKGLPKNTGAGQEGHKLGRVGTAGKGGGTAQFKGVGGLAQGNVGNASVGILEEETEVEGGLDREVIARVIQSELGQIRYCYERQLSASPDLYGKVQVRFTIGPEGTVLTQSVGSTTLQSPMVEGCILRRIAAWKFPKPKGGTQVLVTYPFLFRSTR